MVMFNKDVFNVASIILERDELNKRRSAWFREEGAGVCLDKEYRLLCKSINALSAEIHKLTKATSVKF